MKKEVLSILLVSVVFLAGCAKGPAEAPVNAADTTEQSISQATSTDSDLGDQEIQNISSDLDQVIDTLG